MSIYRRKRRVEELEMLLLKEIRLSPEERAREYLLYVQRAFKSYDNIPAREFYAGEAVRCLRQMKDPS